ncbi:acetate--CoA ligase family protein [Pseudonocardia sp. C8]|uniref:acetate--CoA ligase family protein n=1 Tax=Pseudonocardia sp. C8 TaxID=2762759 RepID=UPI0016434BBF|nr:acetate--CoA ligase [Pseudonocardia sp. C8]MBC3192970.1 acetate--CoA ligase family protein [Pseudonocardia sp. C8]
MTQLQSAVAVDREDSPRMDRLLAPRSIAVIGASSDPHKISGRPIAYLRRFGYSGRIIPVNPHNDEIQGLRAYPEIAAVDGPVDLALIMVPAERAAGAVRACGRAGVPFVIVVASGFAEVGTRGAALEADLRAAVAETGVRLLGPNCLGMISLRDGAVPTFSPVLESAADLRPGPVAFVSQSGAFGSFLFGELHDLRIGLSHYITTGNEMDVSGPDLLAGLVADGGVRVLLTYLEGVTSGTQLLQVARDAHVADKPIVMVKAGRSTTGAAAARSHTASLAGDDRVFDALMRGHGVVRVDSQEELLDAAQVFGASRRTSGRRLTILSESGGAAVMMTDTAVDVGLEVPAWEDAWQARLDEFVPAYGSTRNPVDFTAALLTDPGMLRAGLSTAIAHPGTDMIAVLVGNADHFADPLLEAIEDLYAATDLPIVVVWTGGSGRPRSRLRECGIPCFTDPVRAARALGRLADHSLRPPLPTPLRPDDVDPAAAARIVGHARAEGRTALDEQESAALVRAYRIPVTDSAVARTAAEAVTSAHRFAAPVAVKVLSSRIAHKSEIGGVRLGLATPDEVAAAAAELLDVARAHGEHDPRLLVQPMWSGPAEMILGARHDPALGPVVLAGFGGILVELLRDSCVAAAPTDHETAARMLHGLTGAPLLSGIRGGPALDVEVVVDSLVRLSWLVSDLGDEIAEIDLNPLLVDAVGAGACAVDALVLLRERR